jgi:hypothetical protein
MLVGRSASLRHSVETVVRFRIVVETRPNRPRIVRNRSVPVGVYSAGYFGLGLAQLWAQIRFEIEESRPLKLSRRRRRVCAQKLNFENPWPLGSRIGSWPRNILNWFTGLMLSAFYSTLRIGPVGEGPRTRREHLRTDDFGVEFGGCRPSVNGHRHLGSFWFRRVSFRL